MRVCQSVCRVHAGTHSGQKRASDLLKLELQAFVSCLAWMLGTEIGFSETAAGILKLLSHLSSPNPVLLSMHFSIGFLTS